MVYMNIALYARVSTHEQSVDMQVSELSAYAARMGWTVTEQYLDSGVSGTLDKRPALDKLMIDARMKRFDAVLVWRLDRFGRSLPQLVTNIQRLDECGVRFISLNEGIDTSTDSPTGRLMLHLFMALSQFERSLIVERVKAGVAEAKRKGKHMGRPQRVFRRDEAIRLKEQGYSYRDIAKMLGVPVMTISDTVRKAHPKQTAVETGNTAVATA